MERKKDLLTLMDYTSDEVYELVSIAADLKKNRGNEPKVLSGKTGVLIFEKPSLRTRVTFETAIHELGGYTINLDPKAVGIGKRETIEDIAHNLERWIHLIVARTFSQSTVDELAKHGKASVINALTDKFHPCQSLAFGLLIREKFDDKKVNITFVGDGNNVAMSHLILATKLGYNFTLACPKGYEIDDDVWQYCIKEAKRSRSKIDMKNNPLEAVSNADIIYTDVWTSMGQEQESAKRDRDFAGFQVNERMLAKAPSNVIVSHCLPAHRGEEISAEVLDSEKSVVFDEAENRLHAQKAVIVKLFSR